MNISEIRWARRSRVLAVSASYSANRLADREQPMALGWRRLLCIRPCRAISDQDLCLLVDVSNGRAHLFIGSSLSSLTRLSILFLCLAQSLFGHFKLGAETSCFVDFFVDAVFQTFEPSNLADISLRPRTKARDLPHLDLFGGHLDTVDQVNHLTLPSLALFLPR